MEAKPWLIARTYKVLAIIVLGLAAYAFNVYSPIENSYINTDLSEYSYAGVGGFSVSSKLQYTICYLVRLILRSSRDAVRGCMLISTATLTYKFLF